MSLSDRFGLWLGFHACNQDDFLAMIRGYCDAFGLAISDAELRAEAIEWSQTRGGAVGAGGLAVRHRPRGAQRRETGRIRLKRRRNPRMETVWNRYGIR